MPDNIQIICNVTGMSLVLRFPCIIFFVVRKISGFPNHHHLSPRPRGQESAPLRVIEIVAPEGLGYPRGLEDFNRGEKAITKSSLCVCVCFFLGMARKLP